MGKFLETGGEQVKPAQPEMNNYTRLLTMMGQVLEKIRKHAGDYDAEAAHALEHALWTAALEAIAVGAPDPAGIAQLALKSKEIEFSRWFS